MAHRNDYSLYDACKNGKYDEVKARLEQEDEASRKKLLERHFIGSLFSQNTLLHVAVNYGHTRIVKLLLDEGANVNIITGEGKYTSLHVAAQAGQTECVKILLDDKHIVLNPKNQFGKTPYQTAVELRHKDIARLIKSAEVIKAAKENDTNQLDKLLQSDVDQKEFTEDCFYKALIAAVSNDQANVKIFHKILSFGLTDGLTDCIQLAFRQDSFNVEVTALLLLCWLASAEGETWQLGYFLGMSTDDWLPWQSRDGTLDLLENCHRPRFREIRELLKRKKCVNFAPAINIALACKHKRAAQMLLGHGSMYEKMYEVKWKELGIPSLSSHLIKGIHHRGASGTCTWENITLLDLRRNNLEALPLMIFHLPLLGTLLLDRNKLKELPKVKWISESLNHLYLSYNQLQDLPSIMSSSNVRTLYLDNNRFATLPQCVCRISGLETLDITGNSMEWIPTEIGLLSKLTSFKFDHDKVVSPPGILRFNKVEATKELVTWLRSLLTTMKPYTSIKLLVVGWQGKGKSTLVRRLKGDLKYFERQVTPGVEVSEVRVQQKIIMGLLPTGPRVTFQVWDFAGQEDFYVMHMCFLSSVALYVLVWDLQDGESGIKELKTWLDNIACKAVYTTTVIIVGTHLDCIPRNQAREYVERMRDLIKTMIDGRARDKILVADIVEISSHPEKSQGLDDLRDKILKAAREIVKDTNVRVLDQPVPISFHTLVNKIEKLRNRMWKNKEIPILTHDQLWSLVKETVRDVKDERFLEGGLNEAVEFLKDRGVILHFDDPNQDLRDLYFIDPRWLFTLMTRAITSQHNNDGLVRKDSLFVDSKGEVGFTEKSRERGILLLSRFHVVHVLDRDNLLMPSKFSENRPRENITKDEKCLRRIYKMKYLPHGFFSRLIARLLHYMDSMIVEAFNDQDVRTLLEKVSAEQRLVRDQQSTSPPPPSSSSSSPPPSSSSPSPPPSSPPPSSPPPSSSSPSSPPPPSSSSLSSPPPPPSSSSSSSSPAPPSSSSSLSSREAKEIPTTQPTTTTTTLPMSIKLQINSTHPLMKQHGQRLTEPWPSLPPPLPTSPPLPPPPHPVLPQTTTATAALTTTTATTTSTSKAQVKVTATTNATTNLLPNQRLAEPSWPSLRPPPPPSTQLNLAALPSPFQPASSSTAVTATSSSSSSSSSIASSLAAAAKAIASLSASSASASLSSAATASSSLSSSSSSLSASSAAASSASASASLSSAATASTVSPAKTSTLASEPSSSTLPPQTIPLSSSSSSSSTNARQQASSFFSGPTTVANLRNADILHWWRNGLHLNLPDAFLEVTLSTEANSSSSIEIKTSPSVPGRRLLVFTVEHIEALITEWFHGLREGKVFQLIPCVVCEEKGLKDPHVFTLEDCLTASDSHGCVECPMHRDVPVALVDIAPDISLHDVHPELLFKHHELCFDENSFIKEGSFGKIYRAVLQKPSGRQKIVAIKEYKGDELTSFRELRKEINVLRRIVHPNLVQMIGVASKPRCLALELADGSLDGVLFDKDIAERVSRLVLIAIAKEIANALAALHLHKIIHRDLKPSNVLIFSLKEEDPVHVKLSDFGTANFAGPYGMRAPVTRTHMRAPEVLEFALKEEYSVEVDVYSFAILLYAMISKLRAFDDVQSSEIRPLVLQQKRPPWRNIEGALGNLVNLTRLMCVCWNQSPTDRPTAEQCQTQLENPGFQALMSKLAFPPTNSVYFIHFVPCNDELWVVHRIDACTFLSVFTSDFHSSTKKCFEISTRRELEVQGVCTHYDMMVIVLKDKTSQLVKVNIYSFAESLLLASVNCNLSPAVNGIMASNSHVFIATDLGCYTVEIGGQTKGSVGVYNLTQIPVQSILLSNSKLWMSNNNSVTVYSVLMDSQLEPLYDPKELRITGIKQLYSSQLEENSVWALTDDMVLHLNEDEILCCFELQNLFQNRDISLPLQGDVTCLLVVKDVLWLGLSTGAIVIIDLDAVQVITAFQPYTEPVRYLVMSPDTQPAMVISCGRSPRAFLGTVYNSTILPLSIDSSEVVKVVARRPSRVSNNIKNMNSEGNWDEVKHDDFSDVLIVWHAIPCKSWKRIQGTRDWNSQRKGNTQREGEETISRGGT